MMKRAMTSKWKHLTTCMLGFLECLLYGGLKYGWASLVFVLKDLHYFSNDCSRERDTERQTFLNYSYVLPTEDAVPQVDDNASLNYDLNNTLGYEADRTSNGSQLESCGTFWLCNNQDTCLHLVLTIASVANGLIVIPVGILVDKYSIRIPRLVFSILICSSLLMLALSTPDTHRLLFPSIAGISMGGLILIVADVQIGNLFISKRSTVIALFNGAIDSSGTVLLIVKLCYEYYDVTLRTSCMILLGIAIILFFVTTLLLPRHRILWPPPSKLTVRKEDGQIAETTTVIKDVHFEVLEQHDNITINTRRKSIRLSEKHKEAIEYPTIKRALLSPMFICLVLWLSVLNLRDLYFLGTFNSWIDDIVEGDHKKVSHYTSIVTLVQCSGVVIAPLPGLLMDRNKGKRTGGTMDLYEDIQDTQLVFVLTSAISVLFSICVIIPIEQVQYISFLCQIGMRSFIYASTGAFVPTAFPTKYYATLFGVMMAAGNLFSLLQYPLFLLVQGPLQGNHNYLNIAFIIVCLSTFLFPLYVHVNVKRRATLYTPSQKTPK